MGLLSQGTPLEWSEAKEYAEHVRTHGIQQFINTHKKLKDREQDCLLWGDEVEYILVEFEEEEKKVKLSLISDNLLVQLEKAAAEDIAKGNSKQAATWHPEFARYMIEGTPALPYGFTVKDLLSVEKNMIHRRKQVESFLKPHQKLLTLTNFPLLGRPFAISNIIEGKQIEFTNVASKSLFIPDEAINLHPRFKTLTANIRARRGEKVAINVPILKDTNTRVPFVEDYTSENTALFPSLNNDPYDVSGAKPDCIYMDAMCFGMGCCCLQVTFQACNIREARRLYDQLAVISPIAMALTAATPIFRGIVSDTDCRWNVISNSVDDRTPSEREKPAQFQPNSMEIVVSDTDDRNATNSDAPLSTTSSNANGRLVSDMVNGHNSSSYISKPRYSSISRYIAPIGCSAMRPEYNDLQLRYNDKVKETLLAQGIDEQLAMHYAHLFVRDPIVIYKELLEQNDDASTDHFENIHSTNWQSMRFKPPPTQTSPIGWRVEFRSMEVQFCDFQNAAFSAFIVLLTRTILSFDLDFYIPLSKVDENMATAQTRDAVRQGLFYFRNNVFRKDDGMSSLGSNPLDHFDCKDFKDDATNDRNISFSLMSIDQIINGNDAGFPGLVPLIESYLNTLNIDVETHVRLSKYLTFIQQRASGKLYTNARWTREFVDQHPDYAHDSIVNEKITYDMIKTIDAIAHRKIYDTKLMGEQRSDCDYCSA